MLQALPTADETAYETYHNNIVLIADATSTTGAYVEYVILRTLKQEELLLEGNEYNYSWERIGTTQVDLSGYLKDVSYDASTHTLKQTKNINNVETTTDVHTFGDMADVDTATGTYTIPTGSGTVTVNQYDITGNESSAITGEGTTDIEYVNGVTGSTTSAIQFNYNSIKDSNLVYGETTGKSVSIVSGLTGTTAFNTNAIDDANLVDGGVASKSVTVVNGLTGTTSYPTVAYYTEVESECLTFKTVTNATFDVTEKTIGLTTNAATTSSFDVTTATLGLTTTAADSTGFEVTTKHIHVTHTTPTATVTVDKTTDTVTVYPDEPQVSEI